MKKALFFCLIFGLSFLFLPSSPSFASEAFNPNYLISDYELLDYGSMSVSEIQAFLESKKSYLAGYKTWDANYKIKSAAEIIYDASVNNFNCDGISLSSQPTLEERLAKCQPFKTVNPKFLLVLLQKEQGLIENSAPQQSRLDWATGYGCPDGGGCNSRWKGLGKQVNSAALQFKDYMDNPRLYKYQANQTYTFSNPYSTTIQAETVVTPINQATAALYNYTPHVYNGNYNFWVIWNRYFKSLYPNGSLLQAKGEAGVWLIQNNQKRPFLSKSALTSRFDLKKIIIVDAGILAQYDKGAPIKFPQYSIVLGPDKTIYLLVDDQKRPFANSEAFRKLGYNPEEILTATAEDLSGYKMGQPINETSTYPTGALLQDKKTGGVYWIENNTKSPIPDKLFLDLKFKGRRIIPVDSKELEKYQTIDPVRFADGELVRVKNSPGVYVVSDGKFKAIKSAETFLKMGYKWENVLEIPIKLFWLYGQGEPITVLNSD